MIVQDSEGMNKEGQVVSMIDLKPIAKVWIKFLKSRLMLTTYTTTVFQDRLILLYAIVKRLAIDVRKIIKKEIRDCAMKKQKLVVLLFPSLITGICEASELQFEDSNQRIKNKRAITVRIFEMITGESTAVVTLELPATAKAK